MKHSATQGSILRKLCVIAATAALFVLGSSFSYASPVNFVKNGGFEDNTGTGQLGYNTSLAYWATGGYNFVYGQGEADTSGAMSWFNAPMTLWGSNNGGNNVITSSVNGGSYVAADGAYGVQALLQVIDGLIIGQSYVVNFEWAAAQQYGFFGDTTEKWFVNLGDDLATQQSTAFYENCNQCFSGWMQESMTFTASSTSAVLSFLAYGTPDGLPPFSLLDGVSMYAVPEPGSWALLVAGFTLCMVAVRRKQSVA